MSGAGKSIQVPVDATLTVEPLPPFAGPKARVERAKRFIAEFSDIERQYRESQPLSAIVSISHEGAPKSQLSWKGTGTEAGATAGDAMHSLRVALDLLASELARINGQSDKDVYFPFAISADKFADAITKRKFDRCGPDAVDLLRKFAPYHGGNDRLRALHDMDIRDKHVALMLTQSETAFEIKPPFTMNTGWEFKGPATIKSLHFKFPPDTPLAGLPVVQTLNELTELVNQIVNAFERIVEARTANTK